MARNTQLRWSLCLGLALFGLDSAAIAQIEQYACGVDQPSTASPGVTTTAKQIVGERSDKVTAIDLPRDSVGSWAQKREEDVLLKSAEAIRRKLRSEASKVPPARYRIASSTLESDAAPCLMDPSVRDARHWRLLPKLKPLNQLLSRSDERTDENGTVQLTSHTEPIQSPAAEHRRSRMLSRHMTPEELADYVKRQRSRPWWQRKR